MILAFDGFEISPIHEGDAWKICDFLVTNSDRLKRYFPNILKENLNPTLSKFFIEKKIKQFCNKEEFIFTLKQVKTRKLMAIISVIQIDWSIKQGELAYCIDYNFEGQGLTSKAVGLVSKYAFETLGFETLQIVVYKDNTPSSKVAINNGFKWQKTLLKEYAPIGEQVLDMELYELYKS